MRQRSTLLAAGLLLAGLYWHTCQELVQVWWRDATFSHGFLVVPVALLLAWARLPLPAAKHPATRPALVLSLLAAALYLAGRAGEVQFLGPLSGLLLLYGLGLAALGRSAMRALLFPYLLLYFAVPWPDLLVGYLSFPMQQWAASYAGMWGALLGLPVSRQGVTLQVGEVSFSVAAPCSGMRSLIALMALAALMAYLYQGSRLRRTALFLLGAPVALAANAARITAILVVGANWGQQAAEGFFHGFSGVLLFLLAVGLLLIAGRLLGLQQGPLPLPRRAPLLAGGGPAHVSAWPVAILLIMAVGSWRAGRMQQVPPPGFDITRVPLQLAGWQGEELPPLDPASQAMLRPDACLVRRYWRDGDAAELLAVFGHRKETFHSPDFCLLGAGNNTVRRGTGELPGGIPYRWSLLVSPRGVLVVFYYFLAGSRPTASLAQQQWWMLADRVRGRPCGGALVRWVLPVRDSIPDSMRRLEQVAIAAHPHLVGSIKPSRGTILAAKRQLGEIWLP